VRIGKVTDAVIVPDASVLLKWVLPSTYEDHVDQALALRDAVAQQHLRVLVPNLWYFEVGNTLARKYPGEASGRLDDLTRFRLPGIQPDGATERQILRLTLTYGITFYDAAYHALAIVHNGIFVTANEKYLQAVAGEPNAVHKACR
jgi:predicted nucleic acid-binding protein